MKKCTALITALVMLLSLGLTSVSAMADEQITLNFWHIWPTDQMAQIVADYDGSGLSASDASAIATYLANQGAD